MSLDGDSGDYGASTLIRVRSITPPPSLTACFRPRPFGRPSLSETAPPSLWETAPKCLPAASPLQLTSMVPTEPNLQNRSGAEASFLVIGTRVEVDTCSYSDVDLINRTEGARNWFTLRDGTFVKEAS